MSKPKRFSLNSVCLLAALGLAGCGGSFPMPDSAVQTPGTALRGNDWGGHAPLVGAHIFLLQAGTGGYGAKATSLLGATYSGSTYPTALDGVTNSPTNGMYYITTNSVGNFNISGDYTCTVGDPVYLYASGGNPTTTAAVNVTGASAAPDTGGNLLVTFTTTGNQLIYQGESITFSTPFNPSNTAYEGEAGGTYTVSPLGLTTSTFALEFGPSSTTVAYAAFTATVTQASQPINPAVVNLALLGLCPSPVTFSITGAPVGTSSNALQGISASDIAKLAVNDVIYGPDINNTSVVSVGASSVTMSAADTGGNGVASFSYTVTPPANFGSSSATPLQYVYMNEVSTVAAAYALAPFTSVTSTTNDAVHIGTSSTNLLGLQNAANNAGNLYNIQGLVTGTGSDGDTHIAYATTPNGNGTVPQKLLNTLGNILANCVDSANTYNAATATGGTQSAQCSTIFTNATSNGASSGTKPNDTATAMINIVTHPSGAPSNASFVSNLYNSLSGNAPYQPSLGNQPNDFVVGIKYTGTMFSAPNATATDSLGNTWAVDYTTNLATKLSPLGVVLASVSVPSNPNHLMVDPSNNVWVVSQGGNAVYEFTSTGATVAGSPYMDSGAFSTPVGISNDGSGHTIVQNSATNNAILITGSSTTATFMTVTSTCAHNDIYNAFDSTGNSWTSGGTANQACRISAMGTLAATITGLSSPCAVAIDAGGRAWIPNFGNNTLAQITPTPSTSPYYTLTTFSGGGLSGPCNDAVDGAGNVWVANKTAYSGGSIFSVSEFSNAGVAMTGTGGYQAGALNTPLSVTIDQSGSVWFSNDTGASVEQFVGAAAPAVRPLATAVANGTTGMRP